MTKLAKSRIVIDVAPNGNIDIHSDAEVEVICRSAHDPDDELYRYGHYPIPEEWLHGEPIGFWGDGSAADERMQLLREALASHREA